MELAVSESKDRILASKGAIGFCSLCGERLIPKCGPIRMHHWSHKSRVDCDPWKEGESEWHREWKNNVLSEYREIPMEKNGEKHRADVRLPSGIVVEFQKSPLDYEMWSAREQFYEKMIWVLFFKRGNIAWETDREMGYKMFGDTRLILKNFRWAYSISQQPSPIFLDFADGEMFWISEFTDFEQIYGRYVKKAEFINRYLQDSSFRDIKKLQTSIQHARHHIEADRKREWAKITWRRDDSDPEVKEDIAKTDDYFVSRHGETPEERKTRLGILDQMKEFE